MPSWIIHHGKFDASFSNKRSSNPTTNIKKTIPNSDNIDTVSRDDTNENPEGPKITPVKIYPRIGGCLNHEKIIPPAKANKKVMSSQ